MSAWFETLAKNAKIASQGFPLKIQKWGEVGG